MRFLIYRASHKPIGEIKLLDKVISNEDENEYGILEVNSFEDLPKEDIILRYHVSTYHERMLDEMGVSESYVDGTLILYDDYFE